MNIIVNSALKQSYVLINPVKVKYNDTIQATKLYVSLQHDNLTSQCMFSYTLRDSSNNILNMGTTVMKDSDYTNWSGDNSTPFSYVAGKIGVTIASSGSSGTSGSAGSSGTSGTSGSSGN